MEKIGIMPIRGAILRTRRKNDRGKSSLVTLMILNTTELNLVSPFQIRRPF